MLSIVAISVGAALGAVLRWGLSLWLNPLLPRLPFGTLAANLLGGYLIGVAVAFFAQHGNLPPEWRLLVVTGFLGGLTTFSTFSAEVVGLLGQGQTGWALLAAGSHLFGSFLMTAAGIWTVNGIWR
ncbi:fluoride efflux transporter CrcB [Chitinimonas sp.]|uniref:fluoride efflux transporter CrcB n=1 Tax=Chitinimonas sp. TaxID=1934313 RepID=UPI0035AEBD9D